MRLRRLELSGIGPFKGKQTIDFDRLTAGGLFLLEGPTGSGKSTIIDAIAWGLYGMVAGGSDSTEERMRSTHADPKAQSYVDLIFSVEAGTFRVRRTPQWTKPGNKNPTNATAKLWRLSEAALEEGQIDQGEVIGTKAREVGSEITRLVGLNREQFLQTIVLPQGKFAEFLRLGNEDRTKLLEQIFDTSIYREVAEELKQRANQAGSSVDEARQAWLRAVSTCVTALGPQAGPGGDGSALGDSASPGGDGSTASSTAPAGDMAEAAGVVGDNARTTGGSLAPADHGSAAGGAVAPAGNGSAAGDTSAADGAATAGGQTSSAADLVPDAPQQAEHSPLVGAPASKPQLGILASAPKPGVPAPEPQLDGAAIEKLAGETTEPQDAPAVADLLTARVEAAKVEAGRASQRSRQLAEQAARAAELLSQAQDLAKRLAKRQSLLDHRSELDARKDEISGLQQSLALHEEAERIAAYLDASQRAHRHLAKTRERVESFGEQAAQVGDELLASTQSRIEDMTQSLGALAEVARLEEDLGRARAEQAKRQASLTELQASIEAARERDAKLPGRLADLDGHIGATESFAQSLDRHQADSERLEALRSKLGELRRAKAEYEHAQAQAQEAASAFRQANEASQAVTQAWLASVSAILATELTEGGACPVCGSAEHPAPAPESSVQATREEVEAAEQAASRARQKLETARGRFEVAHSRVQTLEEEVAGAQADQVDQDLAKARQAVKESRQALTELEGLRRQRQALLEQIEAARQKAQDDAEARASLQSAIESAIASIERDSARVQAELQGYASVAQRQRATQASIAGLQEKLAAFRAFIDARQAQSERAAELEQALQPTSFATAEQARAARQDVEWVSRTREDLKAYGEAVGQVAHALAAAEIASLTGSEEPQLNEHLQAAEAARSRAEAAQKEATLADDRARRSGEQLAAVVTRARKWAAAKDAAGPVVRLANLANGGSASLTRVPLATFVLQQRFEQIVTSANERLAEISLGRYRLARREDHEKGSREQKTGLGLTVIDRDGEASGSVERSTRSLSGGESFYVSLSLALALADVVRAENGGIQLETLLIDEGFGSLDEATLDLVMATLKSLTRDSRSVGLVSHVAEMKKMIAEQVAIRPQGDGSSQVEVRC